MEAWEATLPPDGFVRVRRTAIVNLHSIERVERASDETTEVFLRGVRQSVPVGRRVWPSLRERLLKRGGGECATAA